ncbi:MAG: hypothetical protein ACHQQ3_05745 [Gemmatimonadales bacterium]
MQVRAKRRLLRTALAVMLAPFVFLAGWALWAQVAWLSYGHATLAERPDTLLAPYLPAYEVAERHERIVAASAAAAFAAAQSFRLEDSRVVHAVFRAREVILGAQATTGVEPGPFIAVARTIGWGVLDSVPGRELVFGAVTQPWQSDVRFRALPPECFAAFDSAGYAKIVWTIAVDSLAPGRTRVRTETRVATTDPASRALFRRYWSVFSPGIVLIRHELLRLIRDEAERRTAREG